MAMNLATAIKYCIRIWLLQVISKLVKPLNISISWFSMLIPLNMRKYMYCLVLLTCQLHTDYTVDAHSILIFGRFSVSSVRCTLYDGILFNLYLSTKCTQRYSAKGKTRVYNLSATRVLSSRPRRSMFFFLLILSTILKLYNDYFMLFVLFYYVCCSICFIMFYLILLCLYSF
jgi:hypothetical protein